MKTYLSSAQVQGTASTLSIPLILSFYCALTYNWWGLLFQLILLAFVYACVELIKRERADKSNYFLVLHLLALMAGLGLLLMANMLF